MQDASAAPLLTVILEAMHGQIIQGVSANRLYIVSSVTA
jgi:hypothetical protein